MAAKKAQRTQNGAKKEKYVEPKATAEKYSTHRLADLKNDPIDPFCAPCALLRPIS
jgi:hypothetical protein